MNRQRLLAKMHRLVRPLSKRCTHRGTTRVGCLYSRSVSAAAAIVVVIVVVVAASS